MPQHPLYAFKPEPVSTTKEHLDNYVETRPFEDTEGKLQEKSKATVQYDPEDENMFYILIKKLGDGDGKYMSFFLNKEGKCVKLELLMHEQNIHRKNFKDVEISKIKSPTFQKEISQYITENFS